MGFETLDDGSTPEGRPKGVASFGTFQELLVWAKEELKALGASEAQASAERIAGEVFGVDRTRLYFQATACPDPKAVEKFCALIRRRKEREPVAYILRKAYFWNEELEIWPGCFIPRPETETLVEGFIKVAQFPKEAAFSFLDLGCGSGAIGIALLRHYPLSRATFSDISLTALEVTRRNLEKYELWGRAELVYSDLFEVFGARKWEAVFCNPPYLSDADFSTVEPELLQEPKEALSGGQDGYEFYRQIVEEIPSHLWPGGWLVLEAGLGQAVTIQEWLGSRGFKEIRLLQDYAGIDRAVLARW